MIPSASTGGWVLHCTELHCTVQYPRSSLQCRRVGMAHGEHTAEQRHGTTPSSADHSNGGERVVGKRRFRGGPMVALSRTTVCRNSPAAFPRFQGHAGMQFTHSSALRHHKEVALFAWFFAKCFAKVFAKANSQIVTLGTQPFMKCTFFGELWSTPWTPWCLKFDDSHLCIPKSSLASAHPATGPGRPHHDIRVEMTWHTL